MRVWNRCGANEPVDALVDMLFVVGGKKINVGFLKPSRLAIFLHIATTNHEAALFKQKGDSGHADPSCADQVNTSACCNQLLCAVDGIHRYAPPTFSRRSANRPDALGWALFFMAEAIRSSRSGFSVTLTR